MLFAVFFQILYWFVAETCFKLSAGFPSFKWSILHAFIKFHLLISNQTSSLLRSLCILSSESTISQMKYLHILLWSTTDLNKSSFQGLFIEILDEAQVWSHYMVNYLPVCHNSVSSTCTGTLCMWEKGWRKSTLKYLNWHFCFHITP